MRVDSLSFKGLFYGPTSAVKVTTVDERIPCKEKLYIDIFEYRPFQEETVEEIDAVANSLRDKIFIKKEKTDNAEIVEYHAPKIFLGKRLPVSKSDDYEFEDLRQTPYENNDKVKFECYC